jgi:hypothetical protein
LACGNASAKKEVAAGRTAAEVALRRRLQQAKREGDLSKNADPAELAHYVMTVIRGMAVQAAGGASRAQLPSRRANRAPRVAERLAGSLPATRLGDYELKALEFPGIQ